MCGAENQTSTVPSRRLRSAVHAICSPNQVSPVPRPDVGTAMTRHLARRPNALQTSAFQSDKPSAAPRRQQMPASSSVAMPSLYQRYCEPQTPRLSNCTPAERGRVAVWTRSFYQGDAGDCRQERLVDCAKFSDAFQFSVGTKLSIHHWWFYWRHGMSIKLHCRIQDSEIKNKRRQPLSVINRLAQRARGGSVSGGSVVAEPSTAAIREWWFYWRHGFSPRLCRNMRWQLRHCRQKFWTDVLTRVIYNRICRQLATAFQSFRDAFKLHATGSDGKHCCNGDCLSCGSSVVPTAAVQVPAPTVNDSSKPASITTAASASVSTHGAASPVAAASSTKPDTFASSQAPQSTRHPSSERIIPSICYNEECHQLYTGDEERCYHCNWPRDRTLFFATCGHLTDPALKWCKWCSAINQHHLPLGAQARINATKGAQNLDSQKNRSPSSYTSKSFVPPDHMQIRQSFELSEGTVKAKLQEFLIVGASLSE